MSVMSEYSSSMRSFSLSRRSLIIAGSSLSWRSASCSRYVFRVDKREFLIFSSAFTASFACSFVMEGLGAILPSICLANLW